jgi:sec-independent protein translocase protein TatA
VNLKGWEPVVILLIILLLFGASRLPALARSVGKSARILKEEARGDRDPKDTPGDDPERTDDGDAPRA